MNADQLAEIRPVLREVTEGPLGTCATLEVEGNSDRWIQIVDQTINAAYPHSDNPEERTNRLGLPSIPARLVSWEAGKFATFEFADLNVTGVAEWIDAYMVRVIGCTNGGYHLSVAFEKL